jgi:4a-hydroxytetrahydrobiopterin dehydratase
LAFTNRVGDLAEAADHHPRIVTEWGRVTLTWWSHDLGGMVTNDFEMAKRVDRL